MYGADCLGVVTDDNGATVMANCIRALADDYIDDLPEHPVSRLNAIRDFVDALGEARKDSMGLSGIVYWPDLDWDKEVLEEESEDEEE